MYFFIYDLATKGDGNAMLKGKFSGPFSFGNVKENIVSVKWMDNDEELDFIQGKNMLCVDFEAHPYGSAFPVRVAKAVIN